MDDGRKMKDGPFLWVNKMALRRIQVNPEGNATNAQALHVYWALCWEASNAGGESTFTVKVSYIAQLAGYRYRTTHAALMDLEALGVIQVHRTTGNARGPSQYTLLAFKTTKRKRQAKSGEEDENKPKGGCEDEVQTPRKF